jgi:hypothetical protein
MLSEQPHCFFQKLLDTSEQAEWKTMFFSGTLRVLQVLLNASEVAEQNTRIFYRVSRRLQNAIE